MGQTLLGCNAISSFLQKELGYEVFGVFRDICEYFILKIVVSQRHIEESLLGGFPLERGIPCHSKVVIDQ
jgi:hypothetical protein